MTTESAERFLIADKDIPSNAWICGWVRDAENKKTVHPYDYVKIAAMPAWLQETLEYK